MERDVTHKFIVHPAFKLALKEVEKSTYKKHPIGCVIFKGKTIISSSHNSIRSSRKTPRKFKEFQESLHAEASAIIKAKRNLKGMSILVIRMGKSGNLLMAKPCSFCNEFIKFVGIKNVFYSNNEGKIVEEL